MGEYKNKAYTLRIDNDVMEQVRQIAKLEDRTVNKQIERMAKEYIENHYPNKKMSNEDIINNIKALSLLELEHMQNRRRGPIKPIQEKNKIDTF